ncbi:ATP-dependent DNA ligase [Macrolepiota fuliginosa MF-IS2]|uniref:DNA ligase n=1 Tax=Macrolepiota fuliginosa MF-IS2 TaxID=1400762 RepID=A0A9P5XM93_9AGAR|nr:ATP-dependent DNA ligase [Macrolepiota fuliginosa MF-IS2]
METRTFQFISLDVDPVYYRAEEQPWLGNGAPYAFLAYALSTLSQTRSRITILNTLTNCLCTIISKHTESLLPSLYLLSNTLAPPYVNIELGLGPSIISRSIQNVSGITPATLRRLYNTLGDPGDVAVSAKSNLRTLIPHPPLTISYVYDSLLQIARSKGQGAAKRKERIIEKLLLSANGEEIRFLTRTLCQNIRVGAVRASMLTALARAIVLSHASTDIPGDGCDLRVSSTLLSEIRKSPLGAKKPTGAARTQLNEVFSRAEGLIRGVFVRHPNYDDIISAILESGIPGLEGRVPLAIGIPLHPTLGSPVRSLAEVYERLREKPFVAEFKYDGQRAQVHATMENGQMIDFKLFSRHLEDMTSKYPDIRILVQTLLKKTPTVASFIMDAEIVAIDPRSGAIKTFQELSNRAKKDVQLKNIQVSVCLYGFDLMYLNGEVLLQKTFRERRSLLESLFSPYIPKETGLARFAHVENMDSETGETSVEEFWQRSIQSQCEGLMIKLLDNDMAHDEGDGKDNSRKKPLPATYEPDKRTAAWLKLKKDYVTGIGDSLDLVPIGAWHGNGRKVKWWSPILMGLYDRNSGRYVAVCKCMSGFTDKFYQDLGVRYSPSPEGSTCSIRPLWECDFGGFKPDVYFQPQEVWEIRGADITLSPVSVAAKNLVSSPRGLSIRFPRFIKIREDKSIEQASTPEFLSSIWRKQQGNSREEGDDLVDVDFHSSSAASEGDLSAGHLSEDGL